MEHFVFILKATAIILGAFFLIIRNSVSVNFGEDLFIIGHLLGRLLDKFNDALYLTVSDKTSLNTGRFGGTDWGEEHIASSQQFFSTAGIQNGARIDLRGNSKGDTGKEYLP